MSEESEHYEHIHRMALRRQTLNPDPDALPFDEAEAALSSPPPAPQEPTEAAEWSDASVLAAMKVIYPFSTGPESQSYRDALAVAHRALDAASAAARPAFKLLVTREWLRDKIASDPDFPCEADPSASPAPQPTEAMIEAAREALDRIGSQVHHPWVVGEAVCGNCADMQTIRAALSVSRGSPAPPATPEEQP